MAVCDREEPLVRAVRHAGGKTKARVDLPLFSILNEPNSASIPRFFGISRDIEATIRRRENRVSEYVIENHAGCASRRVAHELSGLLGDGVHRSIGADAHAVRIAGIFCEFRYRTIQIDPMDFVGGSVRKIDLALRVARRTTRAFEPLGRQLPSFVRQDDLLCARCAVPSPNALWPVLP